MLTKGQKAWMYICGTLTIILGLFTFIPFRVLPFLNNLENAFFVESLLKFVIVPVIILIISVYQNVLKYRLIQNNRERSKTINIMSYLPLIVYLIGLLLFVFHTLTFDLHPMADTAYAVLLSIVVVYFGLLVLALLSINKIAMTLRASANYAFDAAVVVISIAFIILAWRINATYLDAYKNVSGFLYSGANQDPYLFVILIVLFFAVIIYVKALISIVRRDELQIMTTANGTDEYEAQSDSEYDRAYNDILDDFEVFWANGGEELEAEELDLEEESAEEVQEEQPAEEAQEEQPAEEVQEEESAEEVQEEQLAEEVQEEQPVEEVQEEQPVEEVQEEPVQSEELVACLEKVNEVLSRDVEQIDDLESLEEMIEKHDAKNDANMEEQANELNKKIDEEKALLDKERLEFQASTASLTQTISELKEKVQAIEVNELKEQIAAAPVEEAKPVEKKKKVFRPTFEQLVDLAESLKEDDWKIANKIDPETGKGTIKYTKGKQLFLILQATSSDYRITFLATDKKWNKLLTSNKGMTIPKNAKGDKWLKFVNKGIGETGAIKGFVKESVKGANEEIERIAKEKAAEKARKQAERKAAREAAKKAAKAAAEEAAKEN